jgi:hypothetical protein
VKNSGENIGHLKSNPKLPKTLGAKSIDISRRTPTVLSDSSENRQGVAVSGTSLSLAVSVTIFLRRTGALLE